MPKTDVFNCLESEIVYRSAYPSSWDTHSALKKEIVNSLENGIFPNLGLNDETLEMIQDQFRKFTEEEIIPHASEWHLKDDLIPDQTLAKMAELGVFSIAIPENYGGLGMGFVSSMLVCDYISGATGSFSTAFGA